MRVAVVQFEPVPDQPARDLDVVHRLTVDAVGNGARLVVFPELCLLGGERASRCSGQLSCSPQTGGTNSRSPHGMKPIPAEMWEQRATNSAAVEEAFNGPDGRGWLTTWIRGTRGSRRNR